jgi:hypothetical protein
MSTVKAGVIQGFELLTSKRDLARLFLQGLMWFCARMFKSTCAQSLMAPTL